MLRRFSIDFAVFSICFDALLIGMSLVLATNLRPALSLLPFVAFIPGPYRIPGTLYPLFSLLWVLILFLVSVYDGRRNLRFWKELTSLTIGSALAVIALAGVLFFSYRDISRFLFLSFAILAYLLLVCWRLLYRLSYRFRILRNVQVTNVLIIGASELGRDLERQTHAYQVLGLHVVGFLDDDPQKQAEHSDILGSLDQAEDIILEYDIDDIVIALPPSAYQRVFSMVAGINTLPIKVWVIPDYFNLALHKTSFEEFAGIPMIDLRAPTLTDHQRMIKRTFDLVFSILLLPINLILMTAISLAIYFEDREPILFRQKRVGENGVLFEMLKFRTMVPEAEALREDIETHNEQGQLIHKRVDDPRVTRVGRFLRRTSLDELPQVFNILKGEMSLVGPRPELPYLVDSYQPWQRKRFTVPQGLTGWWQVNGRSDKPMHLNTEDDLYYVYNYSVFLDILILIKTVGVVIRGEGAF